jgi:integrase
VLHRALGHAAQWGLVQQNVATLVDPPKVASEEVEILTNDQVKAVLEGVKDSALFPIVAIALCTGMRRGEILALRWGDVSLEAAKIQVEQSLESTGSGKNLNFKAPKTRHGRRNIALPAYLIGVLRAHWMLQQELRLALGVGKSSGDDLVFPTIDGAPRNPNNVTREWKRLVKARELPAVTFHSLRHTHASQLIASGLDVLTISRRLGHGSPNITLSVYGHLFENTDGQAARVIDAAFAGMQTE